MNVFIFLDVDGVLNSLEHPGMVKLSYGLSKFHLDNFFVLRDAFDAKVVVSSTWRLSADRLRQIEDAGIKILDITPFHFGTREEEILHWRKEHMSEEDWGIILDDDKVLTGPVKHLIEFNTKTEKGLLLEDVTHFINITKILIECSK